MNQQKNHLVPVADSLSDHCLIFRALDSQKVPFAKRQHVVHVLIFSLLCTLSSCCQCAMHSLSPVVLLLDHAINHEALSALSVHCHKVSVDVSLLTDSALSDQILVVSVDLGNLFFDINSIINLSLDLLLELASQAACIGTIFLDFQTVLAHLGLLRKDHSQIERAAHHREELQI